MGRRDSLEKGKYLANSYTAARVNVCYKLCSFFQCYFRSGKEILTAVCSLWIFFQESFLERGLHISMKGRFILSGGGASALMGGGKKFHGVGGTPIMPHTPIMPQSCVVTGFKRSMNYNMLRKSDCNWTRIQNHLVLKRTLNHLAKLAK